MFNPQNPRSMQRLADSLETSWTKMEVFRKRNRETIEQYVGNYYTEESGDKAVLVQSIELLVKTYLGYLIGRPPRVLMLSTDHRYHEAGRLLQEKINFDVAQTRVNNDLARTVKASMFTQGVVKVGIAEAGEFDVDGIKMMRHQPYVRHILIEDWVQDMSARSCDEWKYAGHRYRMALDEALENKSFDPRGRKALQAAVDAEEVRRDQTSSMIEIDRSQADYEETTTLWDVYLRGPKLLLTLAGDRQTLLRVIPWDDAPERGPFHQLYYDEVDGNPFPLAPCVKLLQLHKVINVLARKLARQARDSKTVGTVNGNDAVDGNRIRMAADGQLIVTESASPISLVKVGAVDAQVFGAMTQFKSLFSQQAGNLEILGGLGAQSETLGQDQILNQNSSQRVNAMQDRVMAFYKDVLSDYAWWTWKDPLESYPVTVRIPNVGAYSTQLTPQMRTHDLFLHQMNIEPYSMAYQSPNQRKQELLGLVQQLLIPAQALMAQQGLQIDFRQLIDLCATYGNLPELREVIRLGGESLAAAGEATDNPVPKPPTNSTYTRVSRSAGNSPGNPNSEASMIAQMMAGGDANEGAA